MAITDGWDVYPPLPLNIIFSACSTGPIMAQEGGCCPSGSWGELKKGAATHVDNGVVEEMDGLKLYRVGNSSKCIIWNYDIFGFDGGRTRQLADLIADHGTLP